MGSPKKSESPAAKAIEEEKANSGRRLSKERGHMGKTPAAEIVPDDLETMQKLTADRPDGYMRFESGQAAYGELLGRYEKKDNFDEGRKQHWYAVRLLEPCPAVIADENGEDWIDGVLEAGQVIGIDEKVALESLAPLINDGHRYRVYIRAEERVKVKGTRGRTAWRFDVRCKRIGA